MSTTIGRSTWTARLAWALLLLLAGAALAIWSLARWDGGARFFGVAPTPVQAIVAARPILAAPLPTTAATPADAARIASLEARLASVEQTTRLAAGSAGRADALLIAFAARRAVDRGAPLGYLEPLLIDRFGRSEEAAVATVVTSSRTPQTLDQLVTAYVALGPVLRGPSPDEGWWQGVRRELGGLVAIHRADRPSARPAARYERALAALKAGKVGEALSETMRLPGATNPDARSWIDRARRQAAVVRALDTLESAALLGDGPPQPVVPKG